MMDCRESCMKSSNREDYDASFEVDSKKSFLDQNGLEAGIKGKEQGDSKRGRCNWKFVCLVMFVSFFSFMSGCSMMFMYNMFKAPSGGSRNLEDFLGPEAFDFTVEDDGSETVLLKTDPKSDLEEFTTTTVPDITITSTTTEEDSGSEWWEQDEDSYDDSWYDEEEEDAFDYGYADEAAGEDVILEIDLVDVDVDVTTSSDITTAAAPEEDNSDQAASYLMGDLEKVLLEETYSTSVDNLFDILFGDDNEFMADFWKKGNAYDIHSGQWGAGEGKYEGHTVKKIIYKVKTDNVFITQGYIGTKTQQVMYSQSENGVHYTVDNFNIMDGVPYSDNFYTIVRYSLRSLSENKSQLKISCVIKFLDEPWAFVKNMIGEQIYGELSASYKTLIVAISEFLS